MQSYVYVLLSIVAGVCFALWPGILNRCGLYGNLPSFAWAAVAAMCILPFCRNINTLGSANWLFITIAGAIGAVGIMCINGAFAKAGPANGSTIIMLMVVAQMITPFVGQIVSGDISMTKLVGIIGLIVCSIVVMKN